MVNSIVLGLVSQFPGPTHQLKDSWQRGHPAQQAAAFRVYTRIQVKNFHNGSMLLKGAAGNTDSPWMPQKRQRLSLTFSAFGDQKVRVTPYNSATRSLAKCVSSSQSTDVFYMQGPCRELSFLTHLLSQSPDDLNTPHVP